MKNNIYDNIKAYFDEKEMEYVFSEEAHMFALKIKLIFDTVDFIVEVDEGQRLIQLFSVLPVKCRDDIRLVTESFLENLNSEAPAIYGAFRFSDMGGSLGDIFYHLAFLYDEENFSAGLFEKYITHCLMMTDMNYLNIKRICGGDLNPEETAEYRGKIEKALGGLSSAGKEQLN